MRTAPGAPAGVGLRVRAVGAVVRVVVELLLLAGGALGLPLVQRVVAAPALRLAAAGGGRPVRHGDGGGDGGLLRALLGPRQHCGGDGQRQGGGGGQRVRGAAGDGAEPGEGAGVEAEGAGGPLVVGVLGHDEDGGRGPARGVEEGGVGEGWGGDGGEAVGGGAEGEGALELGDLLLQEGNVEVGDRLDVPQLVLQALQLGHVQLVQLGVPHVSNVAEWEFGVEEIKIKKKHWIYKNT